MIKIDFLKKSISICNHNKEILVLLFLLMNSVVIMSTTNSFTNVKNNKNNESQAISIQSKLMNQYNNLSSPLTIINNTGFMSCNCVSQGNGSSSNPYIIENFFITNQNYGIKIFNTTAFFVIRDVWVNYTTSYLSGYGIGLFNVINAQILSNNLSYNYLNGIYVNSSSNVLIKGNYFSNQISGVAIEFSSHVIVQDNFADNNTSGYTEEYSVGNTFFNNTGVGNEDGMEVTGSNNTLISYNNMSINSNNGFHIYNARNITLLENFISNSSVGLFFADSQNSILVNNSITLNSIGMSLTNVDLGTNTSNNIITNNKVFGNSNGLVLDQGSENNTVDSNKIFNNLQDGITITGANNNTIKSNELFNNAFGINISFIGSYTSVGLSSFNTIVNNKINVNTNEGVYLTSGANYTTVVDNEFINNNNDSHQASNFGFNNTFSHNYWSDWTGPDTNHDLIVDKPYPINTSIDSYDFYPLAIDLFEPYISLTTPANQTYQAGEFYHNISWTILSNTFGTYSLSENASIIQNGTWSYNQQIAINVTMLKVGLYNFTLQVTGNKNLTVFSNVFIIIEDTIPPDIIGPHSYSFTANTTGNFLTWQVYDASTGNYSIYDGSEVVKNATWHHEPLISINLDYLTYGIYNFSLVLEDIAHNVASNSVQVLVFDNYTIQPTSIASGSSTLNTVLIIGSVAGFGTVAVGGVIFYVRKK